MQGRGSSSPSSFNGFLPSFDGVSTMRDAISGNQWQSVAIRGAITAPAECLPSFDGVSTRPNPNLSDDCVDGTAELPNASRQMISRRIISPQAALRSPPTPVLPFQSTSHRATSGAAERTVTAVGEPRTCGTGPARRGEHLHARRGRWRAAHGGVVDGH